MWEIPDGVFEGDQHVVLCNSEKLPQRSFVVVSLPEMGHLQPVLNIAKRLAQRGHNVRFVTMAFLGPKLLEQCKEAGAEFVGVADYVTAPEHNIGKAAELKNSGCTSALYMHYSAVMYPQLLSLVEKTRPHAIITDFMTPVSGRVGRECGVPVIVNFADPLFFNFAGTAPSALFPYLNVVRGWYQLKIPLTASNIKGLFDLSSFVFESIYSRACLVNTFWGLQPVCLIPPSIIFTGPTGERVGVSRRTTSLDELNEWVAWVRSEGRRIIYVTFGTMVQLSSQHISSLYGGLVDLPGLAVAWSLRKDQQEFLPVDRGSLPRHMFVHHWFPQAEVLNLADVAAVISHCGWGGLMEIISAGKPLIYTISWRPAHECSSGLSSRDG